MVVALNNFQEECGPVLHGLGEDLQEVAFLVVVHQDFQLLGGRWDWVSGRLARPFSMVGSLESP